jgi:hypothetical protein
VGESFDDVIKQHQELKRRNSKLEPEMPISDYVAQSGGVFDAEAGAGGDEGAAFDTAEWKGRRGRGPVRDRDRDKAETFLESLEDVWSSGPAFDWGDKAS